MEGILSTFNQQNETEEKAQKSLQLLTNSKPELMQIKIDHLWSEFRTKMVVIHHKLVKIKES